METRNESGLEKPATFNSAHVQKAHVLSGHGNRLFEGGDQCDDHEESHSMASMQADVSNVRRFC